MKIHFNILAWEIAWTAEFVGYGPWSRKRVRHDLTAAAAAKSLQSSLTLCDPIDGSPPGSAVPEILQARILVWAAIAFCSA